MPDPAFEPLVEIRRFLYEAQGGELSHEDQQYLRMLGNIEEIRKNLQETGEFDQIAIMKDVCRVVLYGDHICVRNNVAVFSKKVAEFEKAESLSMPNVLRPKIKEIGGHFVKLKEYINKTDSLAKDLNKKINGFCQRKYKMTNEERIEINFLSIAFETESKKATDYYEEADGALKMLESDVISYKKKYRKKVMFFAGLAVLGAAVVTGGIAALGFAVVAGGAGVAGAAGGAIGAGAAGAALEVGAAVGVVGAGAAGAAGAAVGAGAAGAAVGAGAAGAAGGAVGAAAAAAAAAAGVVGNYFYSKELRNFEVKCKELNSKLRSLEVNQKEKAGSVVGTGMESLSLRGTNIQNKFSSALPY